MKKNITYFNLILLLVLLLQAIPVFAQYSEGILVLNEGGAGSNNASVSFIKNNAVTNNIYDTENPDADALGDTAQSLSFNGDYAYIVLNISNKIKVVNRTTFELVATISTGLNNPRYMAFANGKAFVTNWGNGGNTTDDYLAVINLTSNAVEETISLENGVERIVAINEKLYVAHQGAYGFGNIVSVVDPIANTVAATIPVGDVPNSMIVTDGYLYVLCAGKPFWSPAQTDGKLVKIDLSNDTVVNTIDFEGQHPQNLRAGAANKVYYSIDEKIYEADITSDVLPTTPLFTTTPQGAYGIYGMDVIDSKIYLADAGNYATPGRAYIYSTAGTFLESYTVGVIPNSFYKAEPNLTTIDHAVALNIGIFPNPTANVFYLNTDKAAQINLYDMAGRMVKEENYSLSGVAVSELRSGIYWVEITVEGNKSTQRLIVK